MRFKRKHKIGKIYMTPLEEKSVTLTPEEEELFKKVDKAAQVVETYIKTNTLTKIGDDEYSQITIDMFEEETGKHAVWRNVFTKGFKDWVEKNKNALHNSL